VCGMGMIGGHQEAFKISSSDFLISLLIDNAKFTDGVLLPDSKSDRCEGDIFSSNAACSRVNPFSSIHSIKCFMLVMVTLTLHIVNTEYAKKCNLLFNNSLFAYFSTHIGV